MKTILFSLVVILLGLTTLQAQEELEECTAPHQRGYERVAYYLSDAQFTNFRIQAGTTNIPVEQISHVDNPADCKQITAILRANTEFKVILEEKDSTPRFYYQTNNFYYVTWTRLEFSIGRSSVFIVINKETQQTQLLHF
jgi:hypothetical protein